MLPNALIVGPQRAGTTWVYRYLGSRGDVVCPARVKETFFFDRNYDRGKDWYSTFFVEAEGSSRIVEVAPTYFHDTAVPNRVFEVLGHVPVVITLRNPVERIRSLYLHLLRYGEIRSTTFEEALAEQPVLLDSSRYATHLRGWRDVLGQGCLHVFFYEDLKNDPDRYVRGLCSALSLPFMEIPPEARAPVNRTTVAPIPVLSRLANTAATACRDVGLYGLVRLGKRLGLKRVLMGRDGNMAPDVNMAALVPFAELLFREIVDVEALVGRELAEWRRDLERIL